MNVYLTYRLSELQLFSYFYSPRWTLVDPRQRALFAYYPYAHPQVPPSSSTLQSHRCKYRVRNLP
ncbi:hypothetical protein PSEUDO9AZ_40806 [Pseudomonas sp. 9AZ]|nr:hypothetical protein PSEUDO9AZ_40806 [Pseudomonas sp. 9AZ]